MSGNGKLRMVDDFAVIVSNPVHGQLPLTIRAGAGNRVRITLSAKHDELMKLRAWMEDIARGISPAHVSFADGTMLSCTRKYDDETGFAKTERYLDEVYPTSISTICVQDAQGKERHALLKTKHFLNALYMTLLTGGKQTWQCDYLQHFRTQWYAHTPSGALPEHRMSYYHYRCFSSRLLEWYLCCREACPQHIPRFKELPENTLFIHMWPDFTAVLFWLDGWRFCCGDVYRIDIPAGITMTQAEDDIGARPQWYDDKSPVEVDLADLPELEEWHKEWDMLATTRYQNDWSLDEPSENERTACHIRGLELAGQVRERIPIRCVLLYELSYDLAYPTRYFYTDCGRLIFDERFIEGEEE